jgi:hypothetical protein
VNLLLEAQFLAWKNASAIRFTPAGEAPGLGAELAKATIRTGVFLSMLPTSTSRFENSLHSGNALETMVSVSNLLCHTVPHHSKVSSQPVPA